jgi:tRNA (uracil-5-)-methyltransferase
VDSSTEGKEVKEELTSDGPESKSEKKNNEDEKDSEVNIIKTPGVGFCASGWSGGVSRPHCCQNIPSESCGLVDIVNEFLRTSPIPPYDSSVHRGIWRTLTMRSSRRTGECMLVIMHAPPKGGAGAFSDGSGDFTSSFESEKARLVSMLTAGDLPCPSRDYPPIVMKKVEEEKENAEDASSSGEVKLLPKIEFPAVPEHAKESMSVKVTSIYFQEFDGLSTPKPEHPVQVSLLMLASIPLQFLFQSFNDSYTFCVFISLKLCSMHMENLHWKKN